MSREYTFGTSGMVSFANQAVTAMWLSPPSNATLEILRVWMNQLGTTTTSQIRIQFVTQVSQFPTLVACAVRKLKYQDPASLLSGLVSGLSGAGIAATTEGTGAKTVIFEDSFNNLNGFLWIPVPEERLTLPATISAGLGIHLPSAPGTLSGWTFGCNFREI